MGCLFCAIASSELPAAVVHESPQVLTFLDHRPLFFGHCLVIPRRHYETLVDLPAADLAPFFETVQRITRAVERAMNADGAFVANNNVVSQSVPHLHFHVVPRKRKDGLRGFFWPRQKYPNAQTMEEVRIAVRQAIENLSDP